MAFAEQHAPDLKDWIVERLGSQSDAEPDILADFVLALLRHDGSMSEVRAMCELEIPVFVTDDAPAFLRDLFQVLEHKSYLPGAPPLPSKPPPTSNQRKRAFDDGDDGGLTRAAGSLPTYGQRPHKQARRGGGRDSHMPFSAVSNGARGRGGQLGGLQNDYHHQQGPGPVGLDYDGNTMAYAPHAPNGFPVPYTTGFQPPRQQRRPKTCHQFAAKGYCAKGQNCKFEHSMDTVIPMPIPMQLPMPQASGSIDMMMNQECDPATATAPLVNPHIPFPSFFAPPQPNGIRGGRQRGANNRSQPRRGARKAAFSADGPVTDKTQTKIVVESIPEESFTEEHVRNFFSQFGGIHEVSMQPYKRLAIVKFDTWAAADAAYNSPKVIFDNRFVKVYWFQDASEATVKQSRNGDVKARHGTSNAPASFGDHVEQSSLPVTDDIDMEEFKRKQEEAQRRYEEREEQILKFAEEKLAIILKKKELLAKQDEMKKRLMAKMAASKQSNGVDSSNPSVADIDKEPDSNDAPKPKSAQTDALRAKLAQLQDEARQMGLDPDASPSQDSNSYPYSSIITNSSYRGTGFFPRGARGGRGRGRGRAGYTNTSNGSNDSNGTGIHAAYAAFSLDLRPKIIALSGPEVDFGMPDVDEALRRHLFGIDEAAEISASAQSTNSTDNRTSTSTGTGTGSGGGRGAQVSFADRKTAQRFWSSVVDLYGRIPGIDGKVEMKWVNTTSGATSSATPAKNGAAGAIVGRTGRLETGHHDDAEGDAEMVTDSKVREEVEDLISGPREVALEVDYDVGEENDWDVDG